MSRYRADDIGEVFGLVGAEPPALAPTPQFDGGASLVELTTGERRVLQLLADGLSPAAIAAQDTKSEHTVRTQIKHVYRKLSVQSKGDAIARATYLGLLRWQHRDGLSTPAKRLGRAVRIPDRRRSARSRWGETGLTRFGVMDGEDMTPAYYRVKNAESSRECLLLHTVGEVVDLKSDRRLQ